MRERQKGDAGVGGIEVEIDWGVILVGGDVAVGEGDALGLAGGAGGVNERGQIAGLDGADEGIEDGIALGAAGIGIVNQLAHGDGALGSGRIHHDDAFQLGLGADRVKLVELLARGNDGNAAAGVAHQFRYLLAGEGGVDGNIRGADGQSSKIGDHPLPAVLADEGDAVALFRAHPQKCRGQRPDTLIDLIRGDRLPLAELVLP